MGKENNFNLYVRTGTPNEWANITNSVTTYACTEYKQDHAHCYISPNLIPEKIIFNPPYTICIFPDGTKTKVRCTEDEVMFSKEVGVMACIVKKIMARNKFKKLVESGYVQPTKAPWE